MEISCNKTIPLQKEAPDSGNETIIGTKGLRKKVIEKGVSWQSPIPGDEVEVHYRVRLQGGEYYDSSRERGTPFRFRLGQREVIEGWDEGIGTMRKGERAIFTIPPELGYGESGSPPIVPPNSTLIFYVELVSWYPIRDVSGDGGIMKKITREGEGWATPNDQDEVLVKYVAKREDGIVISKSDEGLEFSLTSGHLCPAMNKAAKTMRKGEKAELSVKFSYGLSCCGDYGSSTIDGVTRPYPNLIINLELVSWRTVVDVSGDKKILKKIMKNGEAFDRPNEGSVVKVVYTAKLEDGTTIERQGSDEQPFEYTCAEAQINADLDRALMTMRKGEEAIVKISDLSIDEGLKSSTSVHYEVKLIDFIKTPHDEDTASWIPLEIYYKTGCPTQEKPFWKMDVQERLTASEAIKEEGNLLFKAGKFHLASKKYEKASKYVEYNHCFSDEEKRDANSLRLSCCLNNAACKLKLGDNKEVSKLCNKVLELDPYNVKALFRRSQAYLRTSDLEKAEEDINRALTIDPNNKDVKIKLKELKEKQRQYMKHETKIFSTMISRIS